MRVVAMALAAIASLGCGQSAPPVLGNGEYVDIGGGAANVPHSGATPRDAGPVEDGPDEGDANVAQDPCSVLATCCPKGVQLGGTSCYDIVQRGDEVACNLAIAGACG